MNADYRAYGEKKAWVVRVGTEEEFGSFDQFKNAFMSLALNKEAVKGKILE